MICIKCEREFFGTVCPHCGGNKKESNNKNMTFVQNMKNTFGFSRTPSKGNDIDKSQEAQIGLELLNSLGIGGNVSNQTKRVLSKCQNREEVCLEAISYCYPPTTPKRLYVTAYAYASAGTKYRQKAIEYLKKYIDVGACWEGTPRDILTLHGYKFDQLAANKADAYYYLGRAYDGEHMFDEAIDAYKKALKLHPGMQVYYVQIAEMYRKKNDLEKSLAVLAEAEDTWYFKNVSDFRTVITNYKKKYTDMKKKGYVYRPRKK